MPLQRCFYLFRNWLRSAVLLVVIMGLTWIFGVLIVEVEELVPLAYIYTIMVAFQGLFIFLIFVVFSKQVREAYVKCWRRKVNESDFLTRHFGFSSNVSYQYTAQIGLVYSYSCICASIYKPVYSHVYELSVQAQITIKNQKL